MPLRTRDIISAFLFLLLSGAILIGAEAPASVSSALGALLFLILFAVPPVLSSTLPVPLLPVWLLLMLWGGSLLMEGADGPGGLGLLFFLSLVTMISFFIMVGRGVIYIVDHAGRGGYRG